jgi:hypothetical protein
MGAIGCNPLPCRLGENINQAMVNLKDKLKSILGPGAVRTVLFYLAAGLIIHLDRFILGAHALIKTHDQFDSYWPFQKALAERIVHFQMPGWLPDFAGGIPFFIWDVNWVFLPMIIHGLFPEPWSITAITIIQFLLAGCGAHLLLRRFFETDESVSFLGGLLWAVSTFNLTYWRIFDLAAIPMIFYCTDRIAFTDDRKTRFLLIGVMLLCAMNLWLIKGAIFLIPFHFFFPPNMDRTKEGFHGLWVVLGLRGNSESSHDHFSSHECHIQQPKPDSVARPGYFLMERSEQFFLVFI